MRRWHLPPGSLHAIGSGGRQHELLKQIRLLIVAYDNMDQQTRAHLASTAEVRIVVGEKKKEKFISLSILETAGTWESCEASLVFSISISLLGFCCHHYLMVSHA